MDRVHYEYAATSWNVDKSEYTERISLAQLYPPQPLVLTHYAATSSKKGNLVGRPPVVPLSGFTQMTAGIQSAVGTRTGGDTDVPVDCPGQSRATHCRLRWQRDTDIDLGAVRRTLPGRGGVSLLPRDGMARARRPRARLEGGKHVGIGRKMNRDNARGSRQSRPGREIVVVGEFATAPSSDASLPSQSSRPNHRSCSAALAASAKLPTRSSMWGTNM